MEEKQEGESVTKESGYKNIKGRLDTAKEKLEELEQRKSTLEREIREHDQAVQSLSTERSEILAENQEQLEKDKRLEGEIQELRNDIDNSTDDLLERMREPSKLHKKFNDDMGDLVDNMDNAELPKPSYPTAQNVSAAEK